MEMQQNIFLVEIINIFLLLLSKEMQTIGLTILLLKTHLAEQSYKDICKILF